MFLLKIKKEIGRLKKRLLKTGSRDKEADIEKFRLENLPYELFDKASLTKQDIVVPIIRSSIETIDKIINERCSLARFGDGEFRLMRNSGINFQNKSPELAQKLKQVLNSKEPGLLLALPDCFASLDNFLPEVANFWRKWLATKRQQVYCYLELDRCYYSAFFTRVFMPYEKTEQHYKTCKAYFEKLKPIWDGRDIVICEGECTRFGMFNDLLSGANTVSRIICPSRNAYDKYPEILTAFKNMSHEKLILVALGPTATVLAFDLHRKGFQVIDVGHLDVEYEWFLRKDEEGLPLKYKYVDGSDNGRNVHKVDSTEYTAQIIKTVL